MDEFLSLDAIADAKDVDYVVVDLPEWGGSLRLGSVSGESVTLFREMLERDPNASNDAVWNMVAQCLVDGQGNRLVRTDEDRRRTITVLKRKDVRVTDRIIDAMYELLGIRLKGAAPKNVSGEEASASSPTPSPETVGV